MSEKEEKIMERISKMPDDLKEKFLTMAEGAALALEAKHDSDREGS